MRPNNDKADLALREHISTSLRSVFNRPRFRMRAVAQEGRDLLISMNERKYHLSIGIDFRNVTVYVMSVEEEPKLFYRTAFSRHQIGPLWKIGVTIANKIKNEPFYSIHSA